MKTSNLNRNRNLKQSAILSGVLIVVITFTVLLMMCSSCIPAQDFNPSHIESEKKVYFSDFKINVDSVLIAHPEARDGDTITIDLRK